jgi:hypothetical protein
MPFFKRKPDPGTDVERCWKVIEAHTVQLGEGNPVIVARDGGWQEKAKCPEAKAYLYARIDASGPAHPKVINIDQKFHKFLCALADKGFGEGETYEGVSFKFQPFSDFKP